MPVAISALPPAEIVALQDTATMAALPIRQGGQPATDGATASDAADVQQVNQPAAEPQPKAPRAATVAASADGPHSLGDWFGVRTALQDLGITPKINYIWMPVANLNGGSSKKAQQAGQLTFGLTFDMDKIAGIKGGAFQVTINDRHGKNISETNDLGLLQYPQGVYGAGQIWRLSDLWYRQRIGPVELKLGHMPIGEDFAAAECYFESLYFCGTVPGHNSSAYWYNYPTAEWGARAKVFDKFGYTMVGVYQHNDQNFPDNRGFYLGTKGGDGVVVAVERGFTVNLGGDPKRSGLYKIGMFFNNTRTEDLVYDLNGGYQDITGLAADTGRGRKSFYVIGKQQIVAAREDGSGGLSAFFNYNQADHRTAKSINIMTAGVTYSGLVPGRPKDEIGLAVGRTRVNGRLADVIDAQREAGETGLEKQRNEYAIEGTYSIAVTPGLSVRPNIQWYIDPAGYSGAQNIVVVGTSVFVAL